MSGQLKRACAVLVLVLAACAGHPVQIGVYTPYPEMQVFRAAERKALELGYTVQRSDSVKHELLVQRPLNPPAGGADREEILVQIGQDVTGSTKLTITSSRVLPATADHPLKRVAASSRTNADANKILNLYMKVKRD